MLKVENFIKGPLTSLLGFVIMLGVCYAWWIDSINDYQAIGGVVGGFIILFMRDKLPIFIGSFISAVIEKFFGKKS